MNHFWIWTLVALFILRVISNVNFANRKAVPLPSTYAFWCIIDLVLIIWFITLL
jgi:hypothetical protein